MFHERSDGLQYCDATLELFDFKKNTCNNFKHGRVVPFALLQ